MFLHLCGLRRWEEAGAKLLGGCRGCDNPLQGQDVMNKNMKLGLKKNVLKKYFPGFENHICCIHRLFVQPRT